MPERSALPFRVSVAEGVTVFVRNLSVTTESVATETKIAVLHTCELVVLILALHDAGFRRGVETRVPLWKIANGFPVFEAALVAGVIDVDGFVGTKKTSGLVGGELTSPCIVNDGLRWWNTTFEVSG